MEKQQKRNRTFMAAVLMAGALAAGSVSVSAAEEGIDMSTDYPGITAKAGETVSFGLGFESLGGGCDAALSVESLPEGWEGYFRGNSSEVEIVHIDEDTENADADIADFVLTLPEEAEEGTYSVKLKADAGGGAFLIHVWMGNDLIAAGFLILSEAVLAGVYFLRPALYEGLVGKVLEAFSIAGHYSEFAGGILDVNGIVYYLSVIGICLFLTVQSIQKRRWS